MVGMPVEMVVSVPAFGTLVSKAHNSGSDAHHAYRCLMVSIPTGGMLVKAGLNGRVIGMSALRVVDADCNWIQTFWQY